MLLFPCQVCWMSRTGRKRMPVCQVLWSLWSLVESFVYESNTLVSTTLAPSEQKNVYVSVHSICWEMLGDVGGC